MKNIKKCFIIGAFLGVLIIPNISSAATVADLQAQIQALLTQISQLQAQLAQMQGGTTQWCHDFNVNLKYDDKGSEVEALQTALTKEGFAPSKDWDMYTGPVYYFGELTASAVTGFQQKYKDEILSPLGLQYGTGYVGKATRAKLNSLYGCVKPTPPPFCAQSAVICLSGSKIVCPAGLDEKRCPFPCKCVPMSDNQPPVISGVSGPTTLKINETGKWEIKASDPEQGVLTYSVLWGDEAIGASAQLAQPLRYYSQTATFTHSYSKAGIYNPTFTVTDNQGLSAKTSISVNVGEVSTQPYLSISPTNLVQGNTYIFTGTLKYARPYSNFYLYLQRPDGSMKESGRNVGVTDSSGYLSVSTTQKIEGGQTGIYKAWVIGSVGNEKSNTVEFNISATATPSITVLSPNGGEALTQGTTYNIKWSNSYPITSTSTATLSVYGADGTYKGGIGNVWNTGSFSWTVGKVTTAYKEWSTLPFGQYRIRVTDSTSGTATDGVYDESDAPFSIVAAGTAAGAGESPQLNQMASALESAKALLNQFLQALKNL